MAKIAWAVFLMAACAHLPCRVREPVMPKWVTSSGSTMTFIVDAPDGAIGVWVRYGQGINNMGYMSDEVRKGEPIVVKNMRPGKLYYCQVGYRMPCGIAYGPIREYVTLSKIKNPAG